MTQPSKTVRVPQGSQPSFADVLVGIMIVGSDDGTPKARLMIRSSSESKRVDLAEGLSEDLFDAGTVTLDHVHLPEGKHRGEVTLTFRGTDADAPSSGDPQSPT